MEIFKMQLGLDLVSIKNQSGSCEFNMPVDPRMLSFFGDGQLIFVLGKLHLDGDEPEFHIEELLGDQVPYDWSVAKS